MSRCRYRTVLLMLLSLLIALEGCGGEESVQGMPGGGGGGGSRRAESRVSVVDDDSSEPLAGLTPRNFGDEARGPFVRQYPIVEQAPIQTRSTVVGPGSGDVVLGPLANYPPQSLQLLAIMTRTAEPKAMFLPPDGSRRAVLARVDDRVGPEGRGRIVDIQPNRVIIRYEAFGGSDPSVDDGTDVEIRLRPEPLNIDDYVFEPY